MHVANLFEKRQQSVETRPHAYPTQPRQVKAA